MLTPAQYTTLKNHIAADPTLSQIPPGSDGDVAIATILNAAASPTFYVWKRAVRLMDVQQATGFNWTLVDGLSAGRARIWEWMSRSGTMDASQDNVRDGINNAFQGAGQLPAMRLAVFGACQRVASRFEKLFATGAGTTTTNAGDGPAVMAVEGPVSYQDVGTARES